MNSTISKAISTILAGTALVLILLMIGYVYGSRSAQLELAGLKGKISQQTEQAEATLLAITKKSKKKKRPSVTLKQFYKRNKTMLQRLKLFGLLASLLIALYGCASSPRVGACSGSSSGAAATNGQDSDRYAAEASGLLPESNSKRLRAALADVETLSAAYNSCRARAFMALE